MFGLYHKYANELRRLLRVQLPAERKLTESEQKLVEQALTFHPNAKQKIGCGIQRIVVRRMIAADGGHDVCCFVAQRVDGTEEDFSMLKIYKKQHSSGFDLAGGGKVRDGPKQYGEMFRYNASYHRKKQQDEAKQEAREREYWHNVNDDE